jgi:membrane-associated phospholipid phosphatase
MDWLKTLDVDLFRWINLEWANPILDRLMPFLSGNAYFIPGAIILGILLIWKGKTRGLVFLLMLLLVVAIGDGFVCNTLKKAIARPRPFVDIVEVHLLGGKGGSGSMPSSHAANWFSAAMVAFLYYRKSLWFMLPIAILVGLSRIYTGMHYPSDVLVGALLGAGYGAATVLLVNSLWIWIGQKWFPLWWEKMPSLLNPVVKQEPDEMAQEPELPPRFRPPGAAPPQPRHTTIDMQWLHLGYVVTGALLLARLWYIGSGTIQLAEDEAYQWTWSKHLDLSYYSKPPLIAYTQFVGTALWGDNAFGVRFFSPVISAVLGLVVLRFFAREVNARAGFFLLLIVTATPLMAAGSILMTIDPLSVLFWSAAMIAGWRAVQPNASTRQWLWVGLWMGLGFLSKYTQLFQLLCWAVFFVLWPPARKHLRRPGPWLALGINALAALPVLIWNQQHHWITVTHIAERGGVDKPWSPTLRFAGEFLGSELFLLNPVFFVAAAWAAFAFWRTSRHNPRLIFFFSMGAPLFLAYALYSLKSRILPNWIAPSVLPLFCVMVIYWDTRLRLGSNRIKAWLATGLILGSILVVLGYNTNLISHITKHQLPVKYDPLHRVRGWTDTAKLVGNARNELLSEGKPVFIIGDHYGTVGQVSFYLPEAKARVRNDPLVFYKTSPDPRNQFYFWPGYTNRHGENAIYFVELSRNDPRPKPPPPILLEQFESVSDLGIRNVLDRKQLLRPLQFYACRNLR